MLFTRKLITKFIPDFVKVTDEQLTVAVNSLGMEVESVFKYPEVNNIVVGKLLKATPVEGTHLNQCEVQTDEKTIQHIICGASNLQVGKYVLVAQEGAKMPSGITITKRKIHGMESNGMMCAYSELAGKDDFVAEDEKDEIIMLDEGMVGNTNWRPLIGLDDTIYDITVPANRNDENCYLVFCYEVANKLDLKFAIDYENWEPRKIGKKQNVKVDESICSYLSFTDLNITNEYKTRSNWEMKSALMNSGVKPINSLLDRLACLTLLTNCPTHVYDASKIKGDLICKLAVNGTKFNALNGKTYELTNEDVVICDETGPVSLACVIGSDATKVTDNTKTIRIEIGNFQFANVRNTSIRLNAATEASHRASRGYSNYLNLLATSLIKQYFNVETDTKIYFKPNWLQEPINFSYETLAWFIHEQIDKRFVVNSLKKLGFRPKSLTANSFYAPEWRTDVFSQEDLFEEILKIVDINNLKPIAITDNLLPLADNTEYELKQALKNIIINNFINEVKTYNLTNKANLNKFNFFNVKDHIKIQCNNANREYFRSSLIDNMLKVYQYNAARKLDLMPIFEIQRLFSNSKKWTNLSLITTEKYVIDKVADSYFTVNVNNLKGLCNSLAKCLNTTFTYKPVENEYFYGNECVEIIWNDKVIGYIGKIKNSLLKDYDLFSKSIYCMSFNIDEIIANYKKPQLIVKPIGQFQQLSKDVNVVLNKASANQIDEKIAQIKKQKYVDSAKIINVFNKDNNVIYTVRYYLIDTKQFTTDEINIISHEIEELIK